MSTSSTSANAPVNSAQVQVLIVGAGPVGLTLACALRRQGVACRIIDQTEGPTPLNESRALAVWERTQEVFADLGCGQPARERGTKIHCLNAYAQGERVVHIRLDLDGDDTPYPSVLSLPQSQTERILLDRLAGLGLQVERSTRLMDVRQDDDGVTATLVLPDGRESAVRQDWLVGCDGARSMVRQKLGLSFQGAEYEEPFRLADVRLDWRLPEDEGHILLLPEGAVLAAFPLPEKGRWRLVDASPSDVEEPEAVLERFRQLLHAAGHREATLTDAQWVTSFRIHRRMTDRLRVGRCFLAGDAAHIHSPFGGQGMNTGIQDAHNLAWKLALVLADASPESLLDSYQAERYPVARRILRGTDLLTRLLTLRRPVATAVRNALASFLTEFGFVQRRIARAMSELDVDYRRSPIVGQDGGFAFAGGPHPGDRVPNVPLGSDPGQPPVRLFEVLPSGRHALLLFPGESLLAAADVRDLVRGKYAPWIKVYLVAGPERETAGLPWEGERLSDPDGRLHTRFGARSACLYLIRPDGYVGCRGHPPDAGKLSGYLGKVFREPIPRTRANKVLS